MELIRVEMVWRSHGDCAEPVIDPGVPETLFMSGAPCATPVRGREAGDARSVGLGNGQRSRWKASQRRGIPVVPLHTSIKQKGLAVYDALPEPALRAALDDPFAQLTGRWPMDFEVVFDSARLTPHMQRLRLCSSNSPAQDVMPLVAVEGSGPVRRRQHDPAA